jgi:hypothetical protein
MTNKPTPAELDELERMEKAATPAPWRWVLGTETNDLHIVAQDGHSHIVMDLVRWGMGRAIARFRDFKACMMRKATEYAKAWPNREHHAHWDSDVDHPDAQLMLKARNALPGLIAAARERDTLAEQLQQATEDSAGHELSSDAINEARQYLKLHMGIEMAFFDDCIHNAVAMYLQAKADGEAMREELSHRFIICNAGDTVCGLCGATSGHGERLWHEDACVLKPHPGTTLAAENQRKTDEVERLREVLKRVHGYAADIRRHICAEAADPDEPKFARPAVAACVGLMNRELAAALAGGEVQRG